MLFISFNARKPMPIFIHCYTLIVSNTELSSNTSSCSNCIVGLLATLRKALLRLGCNKDDIKDIMEFIEFKIFMQKLGKLSPSAKKNILTEIIISGEVSQETLDHVQIPVK